MTKCRHEKNQVSFGWSGFEDQGGHGGRLRGSSCPATALPKPSPSGTKPMAAPRKTGRKRPYPGRKPKILSDFNSDFKTGYNFGHFFEN